MQTMGSGSIGETRRSGFKSQCSHQSHKFLFSCCRYNYMRVQVSRISIYQNAKFLAVIYIPIGLIYSLIGVGFLLSGVDYLRFTGFVFLLGPIWMSGLVLVTHVFMATIYNFIASKMGGVEFDLTELPENEEVPKDNFGD